MNPEIYLASLLHNLFVIICMMSALWIISLIKKDASIVDIFWGAGFIIVAWFSFLFSGGSLQFKLNSKLLTTILVTVWGTRLSLHILIRNWGKGEDYRYVNMRKKWGTAFWITSLFQVFLLQGILMFVITFPVQFINADPGQLWITPIVLTGTTIWCIGFTFETVGDYQLKKFLSNPENKGKIMNRGLWHFTRHPNYFGEAVIWWGIFLIAVSLDGGYITAIAPICITFLLLRVSGVTLLEKNLINENPDYAQYTETTNAFFPWFPRK